MKITVTGTSRIKVPAEHAEVAFSVGRRGTERDAVIEQVSEAAQVVRNLLNELTPDDDGDEPQLSGLRTWTDFQPGEQPTHLAQIDGTVVVWELSELGTFLARLAAVEGITVDNVQWKLTRNTRDAVEPEAIRDAFQDAQQRARWIAAAAGKQGFHVSQVTDGGGPPGIFYKHAMMASDGAPSLDLDPVDVEISVSLVVEFTNDPQ